MIEQENSGKDSKIYGIHIVVVVVVVYLFTHTQVEHKVRLNMHVIIYN